MLVTRISTGPSASRTDRDQRRQRLGSIGVGREGAYLATGLRAQLGSRLLDPLARSARDRDARALAGQRLRRRAPDAPCSRPSRARRGFATPRSNRLAGGSASCGTVKGETSYTLPGVPPSAITRAPSAPVTSLRFSAGSDARERARAQLVLLAAGLQGRGAVHHDVDLLLAVVGVVVLRIPVRVRRHVDHLESEGLALRGRAARASSRHRRRCRIRPASSPSRQPCVSLSRRC